VLLALFDQALFTPLRPKDPKDFLEANNIELLHIVVFKIVESVFFQDLSGSSIVNSCPEVKSFLESCEISGCVQEEHVVGEELGLRLCHIKYL
jgi:hypothetical protein